MPQLAVPLLLTVVSYLIGGLSTGYWLVRLRTGHDIRTHGSGGTGATNAGRLLGKGGFTLVFFGDALKAAIMLTVASVLCQDSRWHHVIAFVVIAGHIWPLQLGFRGGKGISTLMGAWLVLSPLVLLPSLLLGLLCLAILKRFTVSGLIGLLLFPPSVFVLFHHSPLATLFAVLSLVIIFYAHRHHIFPQKSKHLQ